MNKMTKGLLVAGMVLTVASAGAVARPATADAAVAVSSSSNIDKINELIKEKMEIVAQKKVSRDKAEQKALGMRIGEIEREIKELKKGGSSSSNNGSVGNSNTEKINALIKEKMEIIAKKKVSRDKKEQKELGKQIDKIEKEIKKLKKNK